MFQDKLQQIISDSKKSLLWVAILSAIPYLHWFGLLLMLVVTLRKGWREGLLLAVVVAAFSGIWAGFSQHYSAAEAILQSINPFVLWLFAVILATTVSWQMVLQVMTLLGVIAVLLLYRLFPEGTLAWSQALTANMQQMITAHPGLLENVDPADWQRWLVIFGAFAPGLRVTLFLGINLVTLILARYVQATLYNPGGLRKELYHWHLNYLFGVVVIALFITASVVQGHTWLSFIPVLTLPLLCIGLSLFHYFTARYKYQLVILTVFYICVITVLPQLLLLAMFFGLLDCFINFRKRFALEKR